MISNVASFARTGLNCAVTTIGTVGAVKAGLLVTGGVTKLVADYAGGFKFGMEDSIGTKAAGLRDWAADNSVSNLVKGFGPSQLYSALTFNIPKADRAKSQALTGVWALGFSLVVLEAGSRLLGGSVSPVGLAKNVWATVR